MTEILAYCLAKPGAYLDHPFGTDFDVVKVKAPSQDKGRIFAQVFELRGEPKVTLNCSAEMGEFYRGVYAGSVTRGWHCPPVQQPYFNTISIDGDVPWEELLRMADHAYEVVVAKLPRYARKELEELSSGK